MKYYTKEIWSEEGYQRTAGIKARDDVDKILEKNGYEFVTEEFGAEDDPYGNGMLVYKKE